MLSSMAHYIAECFVINNLTEVSYPTVIGVFSLSNHLSNFSKNLGMQVGMFI